MFISYGSIVSMVTYMYMYMCRYIHVYGGIVYMLHFTCMHLLVVGGSDMISLPCQHVHIYYV